jgi:farnesyl diphosphate synthase
MTQDASQQELEAALARIAEAVEQKLDRLLPQVDGPEGRLAEAMRYAVFAGGKRLRPFLVVACADLFGVGRETSLRAAAAVECVHTYSLVHDDLPSMDDDDLRRGKPTTHVAFDEATAILVGDALQAMAFEILGDEKTHPDPRVRAEMMRSLAVAGGYHGMVGGQMIDLVAETTKMDVNGITRLQQLKTGALISFSAEAGAILGRADTVKRHALRFYAHDMGLAFQIADDLLDVVGDEVTLGKTPGKDAKAGKATLVAALGEERARTQAEMLTAQAIGHLEPFGEQAALLRALAQFAINRNK